MIIEHRWRDPKETNPKKFKAKIARFNLVDLAGAEGLSSSGQGKQETVSINTGLLALGQVISARATGKFVPYRDHVLTRLLQSSLDGNSKTLMLACISSAQQNLGQTASTLRYAFSAMSIVNTPDVNEMDVEEEGSPMDHDVEVYILSLSLSRVRSLSLYTCIHKYIYISSRHIQDDQNSQLTSHIFSLSLAVYRIQSWRSIDERCG